MNNQQEQENTEKSSKQIDEAQNQSDILNSQNKFQINQQSGSEQTFEAKSLLEILNSQDKCIIQQQNGEIFYISIKHEKQNITQFKKELIKALKYSLNKINNIYWNFIQETHKYLFCFKESNCKFDGLRFVKDDEYLDDYLSLMMGLSNQSEDFTIELKNPLKNKEKSNIDLQAEKMSIEKLDQYYCNEEDHNERNGVDIKDYINKLKLYKFNRITIDQISILISKRITINNYDGTECDGCRFWRVDDDLIDLDLTGINCNQVDISYSQEINRDFQFSAIISIENTLKNLDINYFYYYQKEVHIKTDSLRFKINFKNETCYIQSLKINFNENFYQFYQSEDNNNNEKSREYECDDDEDSEMIQNSQNQQSKTFELKNLFDLNRIAEYKLMFKNYSDYFSKKPIDQFDFLKQFVEIDKDCEKIIYFKFDGEKEEVEEEQYYYQQNKGNPKKKSKSQSNRSNIKKKNFKLEFSKLRDYHNCLKYQIITFSKLISPFLHNNSSLSFLDLYEGILFS